MDTITAPARFANHPKFKRWVQENEVGLTCRLVAQNEELTEWDAEFYKLNEEGKRYLMRKEDGSFLMDDKNNPIPATEWRRITTTRAERRWLDK